MGCPRPNTPRSNPKDLGELEKPLRDRLWTMFQAAPNGGLTLVSGYRDAGRQWDLRHDRVPHGQECNPKVKAHPATAVPYASNHQKRKAADIGGRDLAWAIANCHRFGLYRAVPSENWHYEVRGTPTVTIKPYPGKTYDSPGPITPPQPVPPAVGDHDLMSAEADAINKRIDTLSNGTQLVAAGLNKRIDTLRDAVKLVLAGQDGDIAAIEAEVNDVQAEIAKLGKS